MIQSHEIKLLISDFDGTLVDTEKANYLAYQKALKELGIELTVGVYNSCFGLRLEDFMSRLGVTHPEEIVRVRQNKAKYYPDFFSELRLNRPLLGVLQGARRSGKWVAIATTARRQNLINVLEYFDIAGEFDFFVTGEDIKQGKPDPECYLKVMSHYKITAAQTLIFEDSFFGIQAAQASGANYMIVDKSFYGY